MCKSQFFRMVTFIYPLEKGGVHGCLSIFWEVCQTFVKTFLREITFSTDSFYRKIQTKKSYKRHGKNDSEYCVIRVTSIPKPGEAMVMGVRYKMLMLVTPVVSNPRVLFFHCFLKTFLLLWHYDTVKERIKLISNL